MELLEFNAENCVTVQRRSSTPFVSINFKKGLLSINKAAAEKMDLNDGDQVKFHQDKKDPENWYIEKVKEGGFVLRKQSGESAKSLLFNNSTIADKISGSVDFTESFGRVMLAGQPTKFEKRTLWGLLVIALRNQSN